MQTGLRNSADIIYHLCDKQGAALLLKQVAYITNLLQLLMAIIIDTPNCDITYNRN
jgi:hypothetical protein